MARSADLLDNKVFEADFFLDRMGESGQDFFAARCYLSAFVSATRSITFSMQAVLKDVPGFDEWYSSVQERLRANAFARFFRTVRNETQKIGHTPLNVGSSKWTGDGTWETRYYFVGGYEGPPEDVPEVDVLTACNEYMTLLVGIVYDVYERFDIFSPLSFYSVPSLKERGLTIEDMEEALGFPRGWTNVPGATESECHRVLRAGFPDTAIDRLFKRYLGKVRSVVDQQ